MNKLEIGQVLTIAVAIDARLGASDETAFRAKVEGWFLSLSPSMDLDFATVALGKHYKSSTDCIMPAHLNAMWSNYQARQQEMSNVKAIASHEKSQGMPDQVRARLVELGLKRP